MKIWFILIIAILGEVAATTSLKLSEGFTRPTPSIFVFLGYAVSFYCLSLTLKTIQLGVAYAVWSGLGMFCITLIGYIIFNQKLDLWAMLGMALILSGVLVLNLLSKSKIH